MSSLPASFFNRTHHSNWQFMQMTTACSVVIYDFHLLYRQSLGLSAEKNAENFRQHKNIYEVNYLFIIFIWH